MEIVKKTTTYTIIKKSNGRFGVRSKNRTWIGGEEKVKILVKEGLMSAPATKAEGPAEETPSKSVEDTSTEEAPAES